MDGSDIYKTPADYADGPEPPALDPTDSRSRMKRDPQFRHTVFKLVNQEAKNVNRLIADLTRVFAKYNFAIRWFDNNLKKF